MAGSSANALLKGFSQAHVRLYHLTGGKFGGRFKKAPVLLLETTGRKSGKQRTTPLLYLADGERLVVVASAGGAPKHPAWYLNLQASPDVAAQVGRDEKQMRARDATPEEHDRYWPKIVEMYDGYEDYQKKTTRKIPLVVLEPR
jgi:deazaflavin-dependent oxidoreductase (nitroreductase family)